MKFHLKLSLKEINFKWNWESFYETFSFKKMKMEMKNLLYHLNAFQEQKIKFKLYWNDDEIKQIDTRYLRK